MFQWIINIFSKDIKINEQNQIESSESVIEKKTPEDLYQIVLDDSFEKIQKIQKYSDNLPIKILKDIYNQSKLIHNIFKNNVNLTIKKLDQFNYYYTDHLLQLLDKFDTRITENAALIKNQIFSIDNKISTSKAEIKDIEGFKRDIKNPELLYSLYVSIQLSCIYNCMLDKFNDFRLKKTHEFASYITNSNAYFFYKIEKDLFLELTSFDKTNQYTWEDFWIDRTLMGKLYKNLFLISYEFSLAYNKQSIDVFKIDETGEYFSYNNETNIFQFISFEKIAKHLIPSNTVYNELNSGLNKLEDKKRILKAKLSDVVIDNMTDELKAVLDEYLTKIEDVNLLEDITSIDIETQNLSVMLKLEKLEI